MMDNSLKKTYLPPLILRKTELCAGEALLAQSVVDNMTIISNGQEVVDINADTQDFGWNQKWNWE